MDISTLTTAIYNAWIAFDDLASANQLSFILLLFILFLFFIENFSRKRARYHSPSRGSLVNRPKIKLTGIKSFYATSFCAILFFCSFLFPVLQMMYWTFKFPKYLQDLNFWSLGYNTLLLVFLSCALMVVFAFIANYGNRVTKSKLDSLVFVNFKSMFIGTIFGLVIVYFVRFFALSSNGIKSGYLKINQSMDESAYLLGYSKFKTFTKVHNFETFATTAYIYASQDLLEAAAAPSLFLISIASIFILFVSKYILSDN